MPKYGMVIDLQKCVGCGCCTITCKTENNTQARANGQTFNWSDIFIREEGKFPNPSFTPMPVLCNHCTDAPCVKACPVTPKAMFKTPDGITMHNDERCIGCQNCQRACPYSTTDVDKNKAAYSVISFNEHNGTTHPFYKDDKSVIPGCTSSGAEIAQMAGDLPPYRNLYKHPEYESVRKSGISEKCIFCEHRVKKGELPYCVVSCPAKARIFGDLSDPNSDISQALKKHKPVQLKNNKGALLKAGEKGTKPNVFYIRSFKAAAAAQPAKAKKG